MKAISLSKYFEVIHPEYVYLRLIPLKSIRNYDSDKIALAIASTYRSIFQRVQRQQKKYFFNVAYKTSYYIYIEKTKVEFYFIIPKDCLTLIKDKIGDTWHGITLQKVETLPTFDANALRYYMTYRKEDALSLAADKRSNALLSSLMSTIDIMESGDKIGIFYNFIPCEQQMWRATYDRTMQKIKDGFPIEKQKTNVIFALKLLLTAVTKITEFVADAMSEFTGETGNKESLIPHDAILSPETKHKRDSRIVKTQIITFSVSADRNRQSNNVISSGEAYKTISGDNELLYRRLSRNMDFTQTVCHGAGVMKMAPEEAAQLLALPGRELLEQYGYIEHIDVLESKIPEELQKGDIHVCTSVYRGHRAKAYLTTDPEYKHLTLVLIGPARAGKSELIANMSHDAGTAGECVICFDYCGNCELSNKLASKTKNVLVIDCQDHKNLQGLGYNEADPTEPDLFLRYVNAKTQTMQLLTLINCVNDVGSELSAKMERYLECAALVAFMGGGSINDVFQVLINHKTRHTFINKIASEQSENMAEYVDGLNELDEIDKADKITVVGTRDSLVTGIIDRVNRLKQNAYMERMLKRSCKNNFNLVEEMQKNQLICIRMPETLFSTEKEKDIMATYWCTKIWLALQVRKQKYENRTSVNVVIDELYQVPSCQEFLRSKLSQLPKFSAKVIISAHYLGQIKIIRDELRSANSSYILISGADKENYNELRHELAPYEVEDVLALKRYFCLCLLKCNAGYAKFVGKLPDPL